MGTSDVARNLQRLRNAHRLTQAGLAERSGLSVAGYRKIEKGLSSPRYETLEALSRALEEPLRSLLAPTRELARVRFRSQKKLRLRDQILFEVAERLDAYRELEQFEGLTHPRIQSRLFNSLSPSRDPRSIAAEARKCFGLQEEEPVRDICGLLESEGIRVLAIPRASEGFFGLSAWDDGLPAVIVNTWERISVERWIFTAAHELGHLLIHRDAYDASEKEEIDRQEDEANEFASHFLMPETVFLKEWGQARGLSLVDRVLKVKRMFKVSYKSVLFRGHQLHPEAKLWPRFHMAYRGRYGRSLLREDEPERLGSRDFRNGDPEVLKSGEPEGMSAPDFQQDRLWNLVRQGIEAGAVSMSRGAEILGISMLEMRSVTASWAV